MGQVPELKWIGLDWIGLCLYTVTAVHWISSQSDDFYTGCNVADLSAGGSSSSLVTCQWCTGGSVQSVDIAVVTTAAKMCHISEKNT